MNNGVLGGSRVTVSKFGLGTMTFGTAGGSAGLRPKVDAALAARLVATALDAGVTLFDSSGHYNDGTAEAILGRAIGSRRDEVLLSTKDPVLPEREAGSVVSQIRANVEGSLRRLGVDVVDLYQVGVTRLDQPLEGIVEGLAAVVDAGLVRHVGITNFPAWQLDRLARAAVSTGCPLVAAQMSYSLLERQIEYDFQPLLAEHSIGVLAWSPLAGGFLTGKYSGDDASGGGGRLSSFGLQPLDVDRGHAIVRTLRGIAGDHGVAPAAIALAWVAAQPFVASVLFGATSTDGLETNLAAARVTLGPDELLALGEVSSAPRPYPYWLYPDS
jgi:aryl-alcohol dehydrogenase-like predicted oxidoreductase